MSFSDLCLSPPPIWRLSFLFLSFDFYLLTEILMSSGDIFGMLRIFQEFQEFQEFFTPVMGLIYFWPRASFSTLKSIKPHWLNA